MPVPNITGKHRRAGYQEEDDLCCTQKAGRLTFTGKTGPPIA